MEVSTKQIPSLSHFLWKSETPDMKQGVLETTSSMGDFAGANYDSVSQLSVTLTDKEQELQKTRLILAAVEAKHAEEVKQLKQEYERKIKQWQKNTEDLKHQLGKSDVLNPQQAENIVILEK